MRIKVGAGGHSFMQARNEEQPDAPIRLGCNGCNWPQGGLITRRATRKIRTRNYVYIRGLEATKTRVQAVRLRV